MLLPTMMSASARSVASAGVGCQLPLKYLPKSRVDLRGRRTYARAVVQKSGEGRSHLLYQTEVQLLDKTVGQLLREAADEWPNRECVVSTHQNVRLTFAEVLRRADKLAAGLRQLGMKNGDRLGIWGPNDVEWFISLMSAARLGLIAVTINPAYQLNELIYSVQKVGLKTIVGAHRFKTQDYAKMGLEAKRHCPILENIIIWSDEHVPGTRRFCDVESLASRIGVEGIEATQGDVSCHDGSNIQFTSGTTGKPKATLLSHRSLVNNARQAVGRMELQVGEKICMNVPFFHAFSLIMSQVTSLHAGTTTVLEARSFDPTKSLEALAKENCAVMYGTPTMWINLIAAQQRMRVPTGKLRTGTTGGSPAPPELFRRIQEHFRFSDMRTIYGLTETTAIAFQSMSGEQKELRETTVGHLSDNIEAMVADESGAPVAFGSPGELWIRGYCTMMRYWADDEATARTVTKDGWLKTGDRFVLRENGYGQVVGRIKDMLIRGGENIFPREIEDFLMSHPLVSEVHVIGVADKVYGEEVCACVNLKQGASLTKDELRAYCKGKIAHFKVPRYVVFVDDYPKTASGKVQKFRLKADLEQRGLIPAE